MSLGMLSLLMVIIVSFTFNAKTELNVAKFQDQDAVSNAAAQDSLTWLLAAGEGYDYHTWMKDLERKYYQFPVAKNKLLWPLRYSYPAYTTGSKVIKFDDDKDGSALAYDMGFLASPDIKDIKKDSLYTENREFCWYPLLSNQLRSNEIAGDGSENPWGDNSETFIINKMSTYLAGRYTFLVIDEAVKFDLNGLIENKQKKLLHGNFFDLEEMFSTFSIPTDAAGKLENRVEVNGEPVFWDSWSHIWKNKVFSSDPEYPTTSEERKARNAYNVLTPYTHATGEYYIVIPKNKKNNWSTANQRYYHRYYVGHLTNSTKSDIDRMVDSNGTSDSDFFDTSSLTHAAAFRAQKINKSVLKKKDGVYIHDSTRFIPWLDFIRGAIDDNNGPHSKMIQRQVAANLIDYSDENGKATTDYPKYGEYLGKEEKIEYCGLEEVPYVAQVTTSVKFSTSRDDPEYAYISSVWAKVTLVNMYNNAPNVVLKVRIPRVEINEVPYTVGSGDFLAACSAGSHSSFDINCSEVLPEAKFKKGTIPKISFPSVIVEVKDNGVVSDVSLLKNVGKKYNLPSAPVVYPDTESQSYSITATFRDPRCNNYLDLSPEGNEASITTLYGKNLSGWKIGEVSDQFKLQITTDGYPTDRKYIDNEKRPYSPTTAKIRNGQIRSLWELGAIHRGEPWRTLNLKASFKMFDGNPNHNNKDLIIQGTKVGYPTRYWESGQCRYTGLYEHGDGALLTQLKLTKEAQTYPAINVFNPSPKFWSYVLKAFKKDLNDSPAVESEFMDGKGDKYYIWKSELGTTDYTELIKTTDAFKMNDRQYNLYKNMNDREGLHSLLYKLTRTTFGNRYPFTAGMVPQVLNGNIGKSGDLYEEEFIGKLADHLKLNYNYFRMVCKFQYLGRLPGPQGRILDSMADKDSEDPRLDSFVKLDYSNNDESEWFKITGGKKVMSVIRRFIGTGRFETIRKTILESD